MQSTLTRSRGISLSVTLRYLILTLIAMVFVLPILFMIFSSLKPESQLLRDTASLRAFLPVGSISLQNYYDAFDRAPIELFVLNSVIVTATTVALGLFVNSMAAFSFARLRWRAKDSFSP